MKIAQNTFQNAMKVRCIQIANATKIQTLFRKMRHRRYFQKIRRCALHIQYCYDRIGYPKGFMLQHCLCKNISEDTTLAKLMNMHAHVLQKYNALYAIVKQNASTRAP